VLRNNPIGSILVTVFFLLALIACWLSARYYFSVKEAEGMRDRIRTVESTLALMQRLAAESVEYGKKNPDLDPVLVRFNLKPAPAPAAAPPQPAARPSR